MPLPRKVILLLFDSLPLGELGCYGGFREKTPGFDRLAARGAVFENAYTPVLIDQGSAFEEHGPWSSEWHTFADAFRQTGGALDEVVCSTLAALAEATSPERISRYLGRREPGILAISGPELVPPPVHGHLAVVDSVVAAIHAEVESARDVETLLIVGALQGASTAGSGPDDAAIDDDGEAGDEGEDDADRHPGASERDGEGFPRLIAGRVNVPLLVCPPNPVVPGLRLQAIVSTSDIVATVRGWLLPHDRPDSAVGSRASGGFDLRPLVDCERETVRTEMLIRGSGEIALRTIDRYVVIRPDETMATLDGDGANGGRAEPDASATRGGERDVNLDSSGDTVAVFRKPEDVWDRLDVGNTMPEKRDMLVRRCRTLSAEISD